MVVSLGNQGKPAPLKSSMGKMNRGFSSWDIWDESNDKSNTGVMCHLLFFGASFVKIKKRNGCIVKV